jgi:ubiquitin carboxyl-terminal hydrolase 14
MLTLFGLQRKVKFPTEYDAVELCTDELKAELSPVAEKLREVERERAERRKVRRRTKVVASAPAQGSSSSEPAAAAAAPGGDGDVEMAPADDKGKSAAGAALEDESVYRTKELKELEELVSPRLKGDVGCSVSGLYDLVGELHALPL